MILRDYQQKAVDLLYRYFQHNKGNPLLEAPTAAGKSVIQAEFIRSAIAQYPATRIICLTHVRELIQQNYSALVRAYPDGDIGIHSAALKKRDTHHSVIFAGIQSAARRVNDMGAFDLAIIDEAHLVNNKNTGQYRQFLDRAKLFNPKLKVIGFTATPYRLGGGLLTEGDDRLFTDLISAKSAGMSIRDLLDAGYLSELTTAPVKTKIDTTGVRMSRGDYAQAALNEAVNAGDTTERACNEILKFGRDRRSWLVFATSVEHAERITAFFTDNGISTKLVTGTTPDVLRDEIIEQYRKGYVRALINVNVLTTGFDAPSTDLLAFLRPTKSPGLYLQACGRGMRIADGKSDCLVLDFAGNIAEHGPIDNVNPPKARGKGANQSAPMRECDECGALMAAATRTCPGCGRVFEVDREIDISGTASDLSILSEEKPTNSFEPTRYAVSVHKKEGKPDSLRVDWYTGLRRIASEWVCLFHSGYPQEKAAYWWFDHVGGDLPATMDEAIRRAETDLNMPEKIVVSSGAKFPSITYRTFNNRAAA